LRLVRNLSCFSEGFPTSGNDIPCGFNYALISKCKERRVKNSMFFVLYPLLIALCSMFFAVNSGHTAQKDFNGRIALFPFENLSEDKNAVAFVMPLVRDRLESTGLDVLDEDTLEKFLLKERIRCTGYITKNLAGKLGEELNVKTVFIGSINSFYSGENPRIGFSARLVDSLTGDIIWADHASATGDDFTGILGLGTITTIDALAVKVIGKLLSSLSITLPNKEIESTYRIAVMPFQNNSRMKDAGTAVTYMFIVELFKNRRFIPIEYGEVRRLVVELRVKEKGELDLKKTAAISGASGVDGIIVGTVEKFSEGEGTMSPEVSVNARLIDAHKDKLLWSDCNETKGDDNILVFDMGRMNSAETVAYKAVSNLVKEMGKTKWR